MKATISTLFWVSFMEAVLANPAADPMVTAGPLLKRQAQNFIGYYPSNVVGTTTACKSS
jgi:hypothetical protein